MISTRVASATLALLLVVSFATPNGARALSDAGFNFVVSDGAATVTGCSTPCPAAIVIPATLDGLTVVMIGNDAFLANALTSVTIPDSVTSIGEFAFSDNQLESVTIPDSVVTIGNAAFYRNNLTSVTIGNSVTSIGRAAFYAFPGMDSVANALTNVTIPDSVTSIGDEAFGGNRLTSVTFLGNAPTAGDGVFIANSGLIAVTRSLTATGWGSTWSGVAVVIAGLPETNRDGSVLTTTLVILAGLTAAAGIGLRMRGAKRG